jgi:hypothetical protein
MTLSLSSRREQCTTVEPIKTWLLFRVLRAMHTILLQGFRAIVFRRFKPAAAPVPANFSLVR